MLLAAARRFGIILGSAAAGIAAVAALFGLLLDAPIDRAISLGYYGVGSFLLVAGFFLGNRGPVRPADDVPHLGLRRPRRLRGATGDEQLDSLATSAVFVLIGLTLVLLGVVVDTRVELI